VQTNILGTMNVIDAAAANGVTKVIGVSSDKAWHPVSPYGLSKAMAECLLLAGDVERRGPRYRVVRYGNVAGSTGSVIPKWREILKTSDTVPVTLPECTRFWMSRDAAVSFVLQDARWGKVSVPALSAFTLGDLAKAMGAKMNIIGLPEYEKLHEGMADGVTSDRVARLTVSELRKRLEYV
jgi:UDP-N-acetylglucosamine 4,6-dehydratase/5-epimerase